jgi:two-component system cell cycle sensor histidine kinase/response regulator CckA
MRKSIRTRLTLAFIGLAIGPLLLVGGVLAWQSFAVQKQQALDMQHEVARRVATQVTAFFEELESDLYLVSRIQGLQTLEQDEQYHVLSRLLSHRDVFDQLVLLDNTGDEQIYLSRVELPPVDLGNRAETDEFIIPSTSGDIYYSPVWFDETTGESLITIALPLLDLRTGSVDQVLVAEARIKKIWNIIAGARLGQGQSVYIVDADGEIVAHRNPSVVLRGTTFDLPDQDGIRVGLSGSRVVLATEMIHLGEQEFTVVAEHAASEALALAIDTILVTVILVLAALAVSSTLGLLTVRQIVHPIQMVVRTAQAVSAGDLSQQVEVTSRDEIGDLASAFNHMTVQLQQILESQARFVAILEATPDLVGMADADGRAFYMNRAGRQMVGLAADQDVTTKSISDFHPPHVAKLLMEEGLPTAATEGFWASETALIGPDGREIPLLQTVLAHRAEDGSISYYSTVARDITERKRAGAELAEAQALLQSTIAQSPVPMVVTTPDGTITIFNDACVEFLGIEDEPDIKPGINLFTMRRSWQDLDAEGNPVPLDELPLALALRGKATQGKELRALRKDGTERWEVVDGVPIYDRDGNLIAGLIIFPDITRRKRVEAEREQLLSQVREQAQRVQHIVDTVPEGVILLDPGLRVLLANPLGEKDLVALAGAQVGDVLTHLGDRSIEELLTSPPKGLWHEVTIEHRSFQVIARPIENGPTPKGWVLVVRDVTQQREVERRLQQQERLSTVGQLAAGMAHDFNNIMAVIALYAGLSLRAPDLSENVRERLRTINKQAHRASQLIQQILDFSRRAVLERGPLDLVAFLKEQIKLLQRTLPEHIQIDMAYEEDEYTVNADPTRIQQAVMNLATNARDAMPGGGHLHFALERITLGERDKPPLPEMEPGRWVRLTVTDTGVGISPEIQPHVFDPFFTTKEPGKGSGLGLPQVYGIVKQHEGHIDFTTEPGRGTTFALYLPALPMPRPPVPAGKTEPLPQGQGQTILVVEDEAATRRALVESLETLNYRVLEALNGQQALAIFEQHAGTVDLVLSDVVMPKMGGKALLYALQERDPAVGVILLTGHPLDEQELEGLHASGLRSWILKPISLEQLARVVIEALSPGAAIKAGS